MRAAGLIYTGLAGAAFALAAALAPVSAQSLLTYPGGMSTIAPPATAPAQAPPSALTAPPVQTPPVPQVAAPQVGAPQVAVPQVAAPQVAAPQVAAPVAPQAMSSCDMDMMKLQEKRSSVMAKVNTAVKPNKKGQVNPLVACPNLRNLVAVENEMKAWMTKNQDWCSIPEQVMDQMREGFGKTSEIADRACAAAAQVRKAQQQMQAGQAQGLRAPAPKLPAGPL